MKRRIAALLVALLSLTGCTELFSDLEFLQLFAFEESDDPDVRALGEVIVEIGEELAAEEELERFYETGDVSQLGEAAARRRSSQVAAALYAEAQLRGDNDDIGDWARSVREHEAARLTASRPPGAPPPTTEEVTQASLEQVYIAQTRMLGGSLSEPWNPPGPDADLRDRDLYLQYCETRAALDLSGPRWQAVPQPACP